MVVALIGTQAANAEQAPQSEGYVVVELFTSQGCSSCPPADRLHNKLSNHPDIIPLSFHVTYWDYLSWKDTLGRNFSDARQSNYAQHLKARNVYTPQMIVNGTHGFNGSDKGKLVKALKAAKRVMPIRFIRPLDEGYELKLPDLPRAEYTLWLVGVKNEHRERIQRGENRGQTIDYNNSAVAYRKAIDWNGEGRVVSLHMPRGRDIGQLVIVAQRQGYGEIVAAGKILLNQTSSLDITKSRL